MNHHPLHCSLARAVCASVVAGVCGFALAAEEPPAEKQLDLRLYVMGNSLTDTLNYGAFSEYVAAAGKQMRLARLTVPGAPIGWLWEHNLDDGGFTTKPYGNPRHAFANYHWDAFTFQPFQWKYDRNIKDIPKFMGLLLENSPKAQAYIYAQWPSARDGGVWSRRWLEPRTENMMSREEYEDTVEWCRENLTEGKPMKLIPAGHVMHLLEQKAQASEFPGVTTIWEVYNDDVHLKAVGSFIVGNAYYATLFGKSPVGLDHQMYPGKDITPEMARVIQESAWQVVASHPYTGVTSDEPIQIVTPRIEAGVVGSEFYAELFAAFGGGTTRDMKWKIQSGALPDGLALSAHGVLTGAPAQPGQSRFTVAVQGKDGSTASREYEIAVKRAKYVAVKHEPSPKGKAVDLSGAVKKFAPGWAMKDCGSDMDPGIRETYLGRKNVLVTHPLSENKPCSLSRKLEVPESKKAGLRLDVAPDHRGDWILVVRADGKTLAEEKIGKDTVAEDGWKTVTVDLSRFAGKTVNLELLNKANGWSWEAGYWSQIDIFN